jgi:hypothetical protein
MERGSGKIFAETLVTIYFAVKKFANAPPLALDFRFCQHTTRLQKL